MGMLDLNTKYSIAQAVTSTGDTASTNVYDAGSAASADIGLNDELWINVTCNTTATSGGSATVQAVLQDSADNSTFADALVGAVFPVASVTQGVALLQACPPLGLRRYTRGDLEAAKAAGETLHIQVLGLVAIAADVTPELARNTIGSIHVLGALQASPAVKAALRGRIR